MPGRFGVLCDGGVDDDASDDARRVHGAPEGSEHGSGVDGKSEAGGDGSGVDEPGPAEEAEPIEVVGRGNDIDYSPTSDGSESDDSGYIPPGLEALVLGRARDKVLISCGGGGDRNDAEPGSGNKPPDGDTIDCPSPPSGPPVTPPAPPPSGPPAPPSPAMSFMNIGSADPLARNPGLLRLPADITVPVPGGRICIYKRFARAVAICSGRGHEKCGVTRSLRRSDVAGREGQGRPVSFLIAWCNCPEHLDRWKHVHEFEPPLPTREQCRIEGMKHPRLKQCFDEEREKRPGEPDEPVTVPR